MAGSIFSFSLTLGDYIAPELVGNTQFIGNVVYDSVGRREQPPVRRGVRAGPGGDHGRVSLRREARSARSRPSSDGEPRTRAVPDPEPDRPSRSLFLYIPLAIVVLYAFNDSVGQSVADRALHAALVRRRVAEPRRPRGALDSIAGGVGATASHSSSARSRRSPCTGSAFFGRNAVSFLLVLPIALPGIVTGMALNSAINFDRVLQTARRSSSGTRRSASSWCSTTSSRGSVARRVAGRGVDGPRRRRVADVSARHVPGDPTALVAGGLLAFALSFDEIVVTNSPRARELTLPIHLQQHPAPRDRPIVNVVALAVVSLSIIPVYFAQRLATE